MKSTETELLGRLGDGEDIDAVCRAEGLSRSEFDAWWRESCRRRVPAASGRLPCGVAADVTIHRDRRGIPHVLANSDADLFFGFGWAMAEDRLFQLDWLRRKGQGRLAEILGPEGLPLDTVARTVGLNRIAAAEWDRQSAEVQQLLEAFSRGVNALIEHCGDRLPVEFDLLRYRPEPWSPIDCLAIENEFRWYLTGRFPVICMPEVARRALGDGELYREFLLGECDEESILHPGDYPTRAEGAPEPVGQTVGDPDAATGSNNWVISGARTVSGRALLGSDPHIVFEAVSCWYQAHLCGGSFNVAGMAYVGMPAIMFGRTERVAWGITNNICSLRDLYQERTDPDHPGCFLYDGNWEPARELTETISVRGAEPLTRTVRFSRNGPVVDDILPPPADTTGPVALKWLGASHGGWLTALLGMDRAGSVAEFREALRPWHVPTFSLVIADTVGHIGFQASGRIPLRRIAERGYRPGWDPQHQWQGLIPFDQMPSVDDPPRGWIASANNRLVPEDFPWHLSGTWSSGWRARRIRQMIEVRDQHSPEDMREMHLDCVSLRAVDAVPSLLPTLRPDGDARTAAAIARLEAWDFRVETESVAAAIFNVFFKHWCRTVARERFDSAAVDLLTKGVEGCAGRLLQADPSGWFAAGDREEKIRATFQHALDDLAERFGPEVEQWSWGRLHRIPLRHVLSSRGELRVLLDHGGSGVSGDMTTVCNTGNGPDWTADTGANYRMVADLSTSPPVLLAIDSQSQSGHVGSPHYSDQFDDWLGARYHAIPLDRDAATDLAVRSLTLVSGDPSTE